MTETARPALSLTEIRALVRDLPPPDLASITAVSERLRRSTRQRWGAMAAVLEWLAGWQGRAEPDVRHPRLSLFAAAHGIAAATEVDTALADRVTAIERAEAPVVGALEAVDCDLRLYDLDVEQSNADLRDGPGQTPDDALRPLAYGMMAVDPGLHLLALAGLGDDNGLSAAAIGLLTTGGTVAEWLGEEAPAGQVAALEAVLVANADLTEPLDVLAALGGADTLAVAGATLAARLAQTPVLLEGRTALAAALALAAANPRAIDHCLVAQAPSGAIGSALMAGLDRGALLAGEAADNDGLGAALSIGLVKSAVAAFDRLP